MCLYVCVCMCVCVCVLRVCLHVSGQDPCGASTALRPHLGVFLRTTRPCLLAGCSLAQRSECFLGGNERPLISSCTTITQIANLSVKSRNAIELVLEACSREGKDTQSNLIN